MPDELETVAADEAERVNNWSTADSGERSELLRTLDDTLAALEEVDIPHVFIGGVASTVLGGFVGEERAPHWLFKAYRGDQLVDIIFRSSGDIYLDDEMLARSVEATFYGRSVYLMAPEDLVVVKAIAHQEFTPRHWHDALCVLADTQLDWEYLARRAQKGPRRVAALLLYAQSNDLPVPDDAVVAVLRHVLPFVPEAAP
jgi:hypothetical protein